MGREAAVLMVTDARQNGATSIIFLCLFVWFFLLGLWGIPGVLRPFITTYHQPQFLDFYFFFSGYDVNECNFLSCSGVCFFVVGVFLYDSKGFSYHVIVLRVLFSSRVLGSGEWVGVIKK
jgi:hypothetical protein